MAERRRQTRIPRPDRVRSLAGVPFGWLDARLHRRGWLQALTSEALAVYAFLCLVADRHGVSFYRRERIGRELGLDDQQVHCALQRLEELELVAYEPFHARAADGFRQVLPVPEGAPPMAGGLEAVLPDLGMPR